MSNKMSPPKPPEHFTDSGPGFDSAWPSREPMKRTSIELPSRLHRRFKAVCIAHDLAMGEEITRMIHARVKDLEGQGLPDL